MPSNSELNILELKEKLKGLTQRIRSGDESCQAEFDEIGELYSKHPDRNLSDDEARANIAAAGDGAEEATEPAADAVPRRALAAQGHRPRLRWP